MPISQLLTNAEILEKQGSAYGAYVTYTCLDGYTMSDATTSKVIPTKTVRCDNDGNWGPKFANCLRT